MTRHEEYERRTEALLAPILEENGFEEMDLEYVREGSNNILRICINKPGGVTMDDCELVSRALSDKLDEEDFIDDSYLLEVSSPGLGRLLRKEKDYIRNMGKPIDIFLYRPVDGQKKFTGILKAYDEKTVTIEEEDGTERTFEKKGMSKIRESVDW